MTKQKFTVLALAFSCLGIPLAKAQYYDSFPAGAGPYFRFGAGPSFYTGGTLQQFGTSVNRSMSFDTGYALNLGVGYAFNKYLSVGFNTGYYETWINSVNAPGFYSNSSFLSNIPFMAEATLSVPIPHTILVPYISVNGGGSTSEFGTSHFGYYPNNYVYGSAWNTVFAYGASAGVRFKFSHNFSAVLGYNYFATQDTRYDYNNVFPPFNTFTVGFKGVQVNSVMFMLQWNL
ncbi:MAG TPA: outer membrane beta-barrel protein [Pseudomonadales bacterium]|nr:outer membrane beta-barrel protein [Pseudomonadales bacterium]